MEDSGYFSHRSNEFKLSNSEGDSGKIPSPEQFFRLTFDDLGSSPFSYLRHGFADEEDFEDFKQELQEFRRLRRGLRGTVDGESSPGVKEKGEVGDRRADGDVLHGGEVLATLQGRGSKSGDSAEIPAGVEESNTRGEGHGTDTGDTDLSRSPSCLKRGVSLRVNGGGSRARVNAKRNGVYFDDSCFLSESPHQQCLASRGSRVQASYESGKGATVGDEVSGPVSTNVSPRKLPQPGSVPPEGTRTLSSTRKDWVNETLDSIISGELTLPWLQSTVAPQPCEVKSQQNVIPLEERRVNDRVSEDSQVNAEQDQYVANRGTWFANGSHCRDDKTVSKNSVGLKKLPPNGKRQFSAEKSVHLDSSPVSHQKGHVEIRDVSASIHDGVIKNDTASYGHDPSESPSEVIGLKSPVTRTYKDEESIEIIKNDGCKSEGCRNGLTRDGNQCSTNKRLPERKATENRSSWLADPKRSSLLLLNLKRWSRCSRRASGQDLETFMEFFSGDEHFQEFERVFETINNRRLSRDMDTNGAWRRSPEEDSEDEAFEEDHLGVLYIDETFLDFFDNDEDFVEFERELAKIQTNRRSRLLESLSRRSSCDIFSDVESFCERNQNKKRTPSSSPKVERRLSASSSDCDLWNSAEEWNVVMKKLRRNSRLFSEQALSGDRAGEECGHNTAGRHLSGVGDDGRFDSCQCLRDCQYTCHSHCVPSVTLDCTTVSPGSAEGPVATPSDPLPSPCGSAETSLTERQTPPVNYQSPQKQQACPPSQLSSQAVSQNVCSATPPVGAQRVSTPPRDVSPRDVSSSLSSERDPLLGTCVTQSSVLTKGLSSLAAASPSPVCVGSDSNQNADPNTVGGGVQQEGRAKEIVSDAANEKDETDSGYRSGTIPDDKLPKAAPSQSTLDRKELHRKVETFNHFVPKANLEVAEDGISFQGFLRVTLNLVRPITMELGARPPSIYELLTREHIVDQSTQHIAFYMPRDTVKSIHITSKTTTREVITSLLKKFHIVDNPRKFAMYEQEFNEKNKLVKLRRLADKDFPLYALLSWKADCSKNYRLVLQENETGEIVWDAFSTPELKNFMIVLDREESEAIIQLQYKYRIMKRIILQRKKELRQERAAQNESSA
ncbi:hypothetical protein ACOMHN_021538 [Nucella lapillus]